MVRPCPPIIKIAAVAAAAHVVLLGPASPAHAQPAVTPCSAPAAPPQLPPQASSKGNPTAGTPTAGTKPTPPARTVQAPLLDARATATGIAEQNRARLEQKAVSQAAGSLPGRQAGPAAQRLGGVLAGNGGSGAGMAEFGPVMAGRHYFPDVSTVVASAMAGADARGWKLPQGNVPTDIVLLRTDAKNKDDKPPFTIEFYVPSNKQADFQAFTDTLAKSVPAATASELRARATGFDWRSLGTVTKGQAALAPAVSINIDISGDVAAQMAQEKSKALSMVVEGAYAVGMQKEAYGLLGRPKGTVSRRGIGANIARRRIMDELSVYATPNNAKVKEVTVVAGATVLSEMANRPEFDQVRAQLGQSGAGSDFGLILDGGTSAKAREAFQVKNPDVALRMRLPGGETILLPKMSPEETAQLLAWAALEPTLTPKNVQDKLVLIRKVKPAPPAR
jgi:hypothetical protein